MPALIAWTLMAFAQQISISGGQFAITGGQFAPATSVPFQESLGTESTVCGHESVSSLYNVHAETSAGFSCWEEPLYRKVTK